MGAFTRSAEFRKFCLLSPDGQGLQRELHNAGNAGGTPRATFNVSPLASLDDLCTTHDRGYVDRYFQGRFTDVRSSATTATRGLFLAGVRASMQLIYLHPVDRTQLRAVNPRLGYLSSATNVYLGSARSLSREVGGIGMDSARTLECWDMKDCCHTCPSLC